MRRKHHADEQSNRRPAEGDEVCNKQSRVATLDRTKITEMTSRYR